MGRSIIIDILGNATGFTKATKEAQTTAAKFGQAIQKGMGIGVGIGMFGVLSQTISKTTDFLGDAVKAAMEEQASIQKLGSSLKANVANWDGNTSAIEDTITAQMALGFSDEEQRDSMARLVAATHDVTEAQTIMRTAFDLSRFKGISLADATDALIRVEGGQYRALKGLGIVLRDGATQTEALAAVQKVAEGQAADYAETTEGKLLVAQTRIGDKMDEIGTRILPLVVAGLDAVNAALDLVGNEGPGTMDKLAASTIQADGALGVAVARYRAFVDVTRDAYSQTDTFIGKMDRYTERTGPARDATYKLADSFGDVIKSIDVTGYHLQQFDKDYDKAMGIVEARADLHNAKTNEDKVEAYRQLAEFGALSQKDYAAWIATLEAMAKGTKGQVHASIDAAIAEVRRLAAEAARGITVPVNSYVHWTGGVAGARASGGSASGLTWVGEQGPELVNLPAGSYVHTASQSRTMASGGGPSIVVNVAGHVIGPSGVDELMDMMAVRLRLDGV